MKARPVRIVVMIGMLVSLVLAGPSLQAVSAGKADKKATLQSFLTQDFDLKPKYSKGVKRYYRMVIVYRTLDQLGRTTSRSEHRGDFERVVESVDANGKAYERITWRNATMRNAPGATEAYGPPKKLAWMEGFSYRFSAEDSHEDFAANFDDFPRTAEGFQSYLIVVDAHFEFDFLRSSFHGAIEKLKRIGDEIEAPDSHIPFRLDYPPVVPKTNLVKKDVFIKFLGLTQWAGEPCAVIAHRQGPGEFYLDMAMGGAGLVRNDLTSSFSGNLIVRLSDGSLVHGDFTEHVRNRMQPPGQTNPIYGQMQADYSIDEISREEYERPRFTDGAPVTRHEQAKSEERKTLHEWLSREYDLKPRHVEGQRRFYRLWQTLEQLDPWGNLKGRSQWRGDLERVVISVDPSGRAEERITWKNLGSRNWDIAQGRYGPHKPIPWADGFSYRFSAEDGYGGLHADYEPIPKTPEGMLFRMAFYVSAHLEFDFLRTTRQATIERLRRVGSLLLSPPEDGQKFTLDFPPWAVNSDLEKKHVEIGFLGLTQINGEPCAVIDYQQGPQNFAWETRNIQGAAVTLGLNEGVSSWRTEIKSWHSGVFFVRLRDGSLVSGWLTEPTMGKTSPLGSGEPTARYGRGTWSIQEITAEEYAEALKEWDHKQSPTPRFREVLGKK